MNNRVVTMTGNSGTPFTGESNMTFNDSTSILTVSTAHIVTTKYVFNSGGEITSDGSTIRFEF